MLIDDIKLHLRLESDYADEDALIEQYISSAKAFIQKTTGKTYEDSGADPLYLSALRFLVAHWFLERTPISKNTVNEVPFSVNYLLDYLSD